MRETLTADCGRCAALCCVAPAFTRSTDFAITKPAGQPCPNLGTDHRCGIHDRLRPLGFRGCVTFDCFGAGQQVTQVTFGGQDWRTRPDRAAAMFAAFGVMRQLHELLWYLDEASEVCPADVDSELAAALQSAQASTRAITGGEPQVLSDLDLGRHWSDIDALLTRTSELIRGGHSGPDRRRADLIGRDLRRTKLTHANLRGAYLIGADLRGVDLGRADLIGADLRGAKLHGTDLSAAIFLTRPQIASAETNGTTRLPARLTH